MDFLFGDQNKKEIREYEKIISQIEKYEASIRSLSDDELRSKTREFKERIDFGEDLEEILPEAYAVAREGSRRFLGKRQYDVQLMGAIALHHGDVAEMRTGEGKTLTAPLAAYLNALTGNPVHIATANDYLATRDCEDIRPLFEGLGLTVGVVTEERDRDPQVDRDNRKQAYNCDIIYGSSNAFAFDYLRDNTVTKESSLVRGDREPGFIIIDEADQILVNDAVMPFKLSGTFKGINENAVDRISRQQQQRDLEKQANTYYSNANAFVYQLFKHEEDCKSFKTDEEMELYQGGNREATERAQRQYSVLYCKSSQAELTEKGWLQAFRYFNGTKIDDLTNSKFNDIINNNNFELDKDYTIEAGNMSLTLRGLEKAVRIIPEMRELNNSFYKSSEFSTLNKAISNALTAYFVLEKGKEYILDDVAGNFRGKPKKKVLLVSNGRTAEGRVYSDGLQQAIELKEKKLNSRGDFVIETTKDHDELASVSQKAFYSIYPKIAGMTGTSARELFEEIYGMPTISIPKNSEYNVDMETIDNIYSGREDKDTLLFENDQEKMEAVINSVLASQKTGQPVLIGTTSVNESNRLYQEFRRRGISCEVLNAENAALEGEIISRAGVKGAVTISTQMAGRGTDIKLGGEFSQVVDEVKQEIVDRMVKTRLQGQQVSEEEIRQMQIGAAKWLEDKKSEDILRKAQDRWNKNREELIATGGLKVIGYSHFSTKRDDDQLRGRAARQADPGVTEFYCSVRDLKENLGVTNDRIKYLRKNGLGKGSPLAGKEVDKVIAHAQANQEGFMTSVIANTQEADYHLARMRKKVYDQRMRILKGENPRENMEYIIDSSIINLVDKNLPEESYNVSPRKKISKSGLNIDNLIVDAIETFGIDLTKAFEDGEFKRLRDVEEYLSKNAQQRYNEIRNNNGDKKQDEIDKGNIIGTIDSAWLDFNENLDYIKFQNRLNSIAQNQNFDEIFAMKKGFNQAMIDSKIKMLGTMMGKTSTKTRTIQDNSEVLDVDNTLNDYYVEEKRSYSNLSVKPAKIVTTLGNKIKLVKDKIRYQFEMVPVETAKETEQVEVMNFDNNMIEETNASSHVRR